MTEVVLHQSTELSIVHDQQSFTPAQRTALAHIGVENATDADVQVFFHVVKRTGLDPFARQIYMIGRKSQGTVKQTIQTGIDGYRLIGRRAANAAGATLSLKPVQWAHKDGGWRDVWMNQWGLPVAARVTIVRSGEEFTATALFDEYKQTKFDGGLTQMWNQRPAGQIAKCAEALAWRMAFPQDLSGIYVDEEMHQADVVRPAQVAAPRTAKDAVRAAVAAPAGPPHQEEPLNPDGISPAQTKKLHASFGELGITEREDRLAYASKIIDRPLESSSALVRS
jgi:phage recombination protein Bet